MCKQKSCPCLHVHVHVHVYNICTLSCSMKYCQSEPSIWSRMQIREVVAVTYSIHVHVHLYMYVCSMQSWNLHNLKIVLHSLGIPRLHATLRMHNSITQSRDRVEHVGILEIAYVHNLGSTRDNTVARIAVVLRAISPSRGLPCTERL